MNDLDKAKKIAYAEFFLPFPFSNRYSNMFGFGINRMHTNGSILIVAKSCELMADHQDDEAFQSLPQQPKLTKLYLHYYAFEIMPVSPNEVSIRSIFCIDPQIEVIPQALINWTTKQFATLMISKVLSLAKNMKGSKYEKKMKAKDHLVFYTWIEQEMRTIFA